MGKKETMASFPETVRATVRGYRLWHQYAPQMLPSIVLYSAFSAVSPYVTIYLSSQILNELAGERDPQRLLGLVVLTISLTAALGAITALLNRWRLANVQETYYTTRRMESDKLLSMDFQAADDAHTHQLLSKAYQVYNWAGFGMPFLVIRCQNLLKSLFGIAGAVVLTVSLFTQQVPESAGAWTILNNPLVTLLGLAALLAVTLLAPLCQNKSTQLLTQEAERTTGVNRFFNFLYEQMQEPARGVDARMYRQDRLIRHYVREDRSCYPDGPLARCARGPMGLWAAAAAREDGKALFQVDGGPFYNRDIVNKKLCQHEKSPVDQFSEFFLGFQGIVFCPADNKNGVVPCQRPYKSLPAHGIQGSADRLGHTGHAADYQHVLRSLYGKDGISEKRIKFGGHIAAAFVAGGVPVFSGARKSFYQTKLLNVSRHCGLGYVKTTFPQVTEKFILCVDVVFLDEF